ncbi:MAG: hypothetical protein CO125_11910, partial [Hydrogenophilales bacterium CG_4_9_14_3_um_filter_59_35]
MNWIQVGHLEDIPRQGSRVITTATGEIALFRNVDDRLFALNNRCPHKGGRSSPKIAVNSLRSLTFFSLPGQRYCCPVWP